jgi:hypothetical protein
MDYRMFPTIRKSQGASQMIQVFNPFKRLKPRSRSPQYLVGCVICNKPVDLRTAKTNEAGKPVHEECYVLRQQGLKATA